MRQGQCSGAAGGSWMIHATSKAGNWLIAVLYWATARLQRARAISAAGKAWATQWGPRLRTLVLAIERSGTRQGPVGSKLTTASGCMRCQAPTRTCIAVPSAAMPAVSSGRRRSSPAGSRAGWLRRRATRQTVAAAQPPPRPRRGVHERNRAVSPKWRRARHRHAMRLCAVA